MVQRGEVTLEDRVARFLPAMVTVPTRGQRQITLVDLATQSSGLPRLPTNLQARDPANPLADYTLEQLYGVLVGLRPAARHRR
jgi:D-alanyl-D-alanine-carboxypeptidase/D-alanyl-D-alanine-endopeptidase